MTKSIGKIDILQAIIWRIFPTFILLLNSTKNTEEKTKQKEKQRLRKTLSK